MRRQLQMLALAVLAVFAPVRAGAGSDLLEERYKAALNEMVVKVRDTPTPEAKRRVLQGFIDHMREGLGKAEGMESVSPGDRKTLQGVLTEFSAYDAELNGWAGYDRVPDGELDRFAGYIRQGMEQAPMGGGIYISGGALIVILILLIVLL